jgi:hypothetical protein
VPVIGFFHLTSLEARSAKIFQLFTEA